MGTPLYVSPEMLEENMSSPSCDIWALGCILFQMLTGDVPFKAQHDYQTFQLILTRDITFPTEMDPHAKDLIDKLLQVDVSKRIGCGQFRIDEIRGHAFFNGFDFEKFKIKAVPLP